LVQRRLKDETFDIVQLEGPYLEPYIKLIRKFHAGPIALRAHNVEWEIWERSAAAQVNLFRRWYFSILSRRIKRLEKRVLRLVDLLVPISQRDSENLYQMGFNGNSYTCPTGYSIEVDSANDDSYEFPSLFHIGGLDWIPNQEGLIWFLENCWPTIKSQVTKVNFYIAGRNAPPEFVEKLHVYPGVVYCGEVENSANFMRSKAVMIVPLLSGSGMRIKIVEGLALGKAIVSTSIGAEGIDVESGKQIAIANSAEQFSSKVIELLENKQQVVDMGQNAKRFASEKLDNNLFTKELFEFFSQNINNLPTNQ
jgi:glycosyltransferase involved in cell wall biosynthesis